MNKWICIKNYDKIFNVGDFVVIRLAINGEKYVWYYISKTTKPLMQATINSKELNECFIPLAEWREKQIKTVLDD
jgi:hypothetical protein